MVDRKRIIALAIASAAIASAAGAQAATPTTPQPTQKWPIGSFEWKLSKTAAIATASVDDQWQTYDAVDGPRTVYRFTNIEVLAGDTGEKSPSSFEFGIRGGPLPNGEIFTVADAPSFDVGTRVVLFLVGGEWVYEPTVADLHFIVVGSGPTARWMTPEGTAVAGFGARGPVLSASLVEKQTEPPLLLPPDIEAKTASFPTQEQLLASLRSNPAWGDLGREALRRYPRAPASGRWDVTEVDFRPDDAGPPPPAVRLPAREPDRCVMKPLSCRSNAGEGTNR